MRPEILFSLFSPVTSLGGVGPKIANLIAKVAGDYIVDLVWHLPSGLIDRRYAPKLCDTRTGVIATLTVSVVCSDDCVTVRGGPRATSNRQTRLDNHL